MTESHQTVLVSPPRCTVNDGNERCCLIDGHPGEKHLGRWYTMKQSDIDAFQLQLSGLSDAERKAMGA